MLVIRHIPLIILIVALVVIHLAYLISVLNGVTDSCIPYIHSCTSISAAARQIPAIYLFKPGMVIVAVWMICFWWLMGKLFKSLNQNVASSKWASIGVLTGSALILYAAVLGAKGDHYFLMRRVGVLGFFVGTYILHIFTLREMLRLQREREIPVPVLTIVVTRICNWLVCFLILLSIFLSMLYERYHDFDDAIEWWFMLFVLVPFGGIWFYWKRYAAQISFVSVD